MAVKLFLKNFGPLFLEKYQHLYKASLAQSLLFVGFYHTTFKVTLNASEIRT
jgi:hypothetical protein